ncbi:MAG: enolase C-terminal domain-like protein [Dehalococcoidia bacterium]
MKIAAVANGWRVEYHLPTQLAGEAIIIDPPAAKDGYVTLPETPGLGLEPNEGALKEYVEP